MPYKRCEIPLINPLSRCFSPFELYYKRYKVLYQYQVYLAEAAALARVLYMLLLLVLVGLW